MEGAAELMNELIKVSVSRLFLYFQPSKLHFSLKEQ